jgi:hypothetical protein
MAGPIFASCISLVPESLEFFIYWAEFAAAPRSWMSPDTRKKTWRAPCVYGVFRKGLSKDLFLELHPPDLHRHVQHQEWQRREPGILQQDAGNRVLLNQIERMPDDGVRAASDQLARLGDQAERPAQG